MLIKPSNGPRFKAPPHQKNEELASPEPTDSVELARVREERFDARRAMAALVAMGLSVGPQAAQAAKAVVEQPVAEPGAAENRVVAALKFERPRGIHSLDTSNDRQYDGNFVAANGSNPASTNFQQLQAVAPNNGVEADETVVLVNGIMTDLALQREDMQALANTGKNVVGIHNATAGLFHDLAECVEDKLSFKSSKNPATLTTVDLLHDSLKDEKPLHLVGHSQGALILSSAISIVKHDLQSQGMSEAQAEKALNQIKVTTFGGAAQNYPDGPSYTHVVNKADVVPMGSGIGLIGHPGKGAVIHAIDVKAEPHNMPPFREDIQNWFARYVDRTSHGPQDIYFNHAPWNQ